MLGNYIVSRSSLVIAMDFVLIRFFALRHILTLVSSHKLIHNEYVLYNGKRFARFGILLSLDQQRNARMVCKGDIESNDNFDDHVCYILGYSRSVVSKSDYCGGIVQVVTIKCVLSLNKFSLKYSTCSFRTQRSLIRRDLQKFFFSDSISQLAYFGNC